MKRYFLTATVALVLSTSGAVAQDQKPQKTDDKNKMNEYDEIIIKRKDPSKDSKVTIEIKGDDVLVDGRPLEDFVNDDVSVRLHNIKRYRLGAPSSQFRYKDDAWTLDGPDVAGDDMPFLGVMTEGSTDGAKIEEVTKNSAAEKAGLKEGDVITKVNDKKVYDHEELSNIIRKMKPDDKVTITYKRNGKESTATATLGKRKMAVPIAPRPPVAPMPPMGFNFDGGTFDGGDFHRFFNLDSRPRLGVKVQDTEDGKGVKVLDVDEGSTADKGGIKDNDVITRFNGKDVNSAGDLADALSDAKDKGSFKVELQRNGKPQTIEIKVPKKLKTANL
jgi:serine protease Do